MKCLYTSDLHGEIRLYQELLDLSLASSPEIIAIGGDLLPSFPPSRRYEDMIPNQKRFIDQFLEPFFKRVLQTTPVERIFLIPGNWDVAYPYLFKEPDEKIVDLDKRIFRLSNGHELIGYPFVPPTPFRPKDYEKMDDPESPWPPQKNPSYVRVSNSGDQLISVDPYVYLREKGTISEDLKTLPKPLDPRKAIYIMHSPPHGTKLDLIHGGKSAGSRSIKRFIEGNQPLLTLHGHIHESPQLSGAYLDRIGKTISVNPGQFTSSEEESVRLHAITFEMEATEETLRYTCFY